MIQFKVNELITVKLEKGKTVIYVATVRSWHCKYLILSIPIKQISSFDEIESIDEAAELLDQRLHFEGDNEYEEDFKEASTQKILIPSKVEFWAHCSNLQVWAENEYNSQLLHSNLAFPLLKKLYFSNDPIAKKVFKKEIAKRLESGFPPVVEFLVLQKYLDYLNEDEFNSVIQNPKVIEALVKAGYKNDEDKYQYDGLYELIKKVKTKNIVYLKKLIGELLEYNNIELLYFLDRTNLMYELEPAELVFKILSFEEAKAVVELQNEIQKVIDFAIAPELRGAAIFIEDRHVLELDLSFCDLKKIPIQILKFRKLKACHLNGNLLSIIPDSITVLKNLIYLDLSKNQISTISKRIGILKNLEHLDLSFNHIKLLPESIINLKSLKKLNISNNYFKTLPKSLTQLSEKNKKN